ncbi:MAG: phosphodiester glycosidase family protein [Rhizobiales bacterium]|nr:phosphodiester glycosidase family protein [Hyphomicrobiales bacterium]
MRAPMSEPAMPLPETCRDMAFEAVGYIVCAVDPIQYDIALRLHDAAGRPYGSLGALAEAEPFLFAMNGGMYHEDMSPVGLYVEDGKELAPLNTADGEGNFFLKPNGVFFIDAQGRAGVRETGAFAAARPDLKAATQSGPMLVIDGKIHPRFEPDGTSRYIRNGVGVDSSGTAIFAISRAPVSLGSFARLFRDALSCPNALFFDGAISALHDGKKYLIGGRFPAGPMVMVRKKAE